MTQVTTRQMTNCPVFGTPETLPCSQLPTYYDVMKYYLLIKQELKPDKSSKEPTVQEISERVATRILEIWHKSSLPTVSLKRILQIIRAYHEKYRKLMKPFKGRQSSENFKEKIKKFKEDSQKLFDISSCKCVIVDDCTCEKSSRIPKQEINFLVDQRTTRKMIIGGIDVITTKKIQKKQERKEIELSRLKQIENHEKPSCSRSQANETTISSSSTSFCDNLPLTAFSPNQEPIVENHLPQEDVVEPPPKQMRINLPSLALACDRTGVSDRSAAIIASAVLKDVGIITSNDQSYVVDRSKVRRERAKKRSVLQDLSRNQPIPGLYFDGRKDKTLVTVKKGDKWYRKRQIEDHYVIVSEPGSIFFGHITVQTGSARTIKDSIIKYLHNKSVDLSDLSVVGCDGAVVNTGSKGGVISLLEAEIKKPLQWFICALHSNELPLRHLLLHLDGQTSGPRCFSGPIGCELQQCEKKPVVKFAVIPTILPVITKDLSSDQLYLFEIMNAISTGIFPSDLANREPGPLNHSRWLTTANRILRLYATKTDPEENLLILAKFVMKVYGQMWFQIKCNPSCLNGAQHLWLTINCSRYLDDNLKNVIDPVIQRNGYFGHPENLLIAMLADDNKVIRELACRRILKARSERVTRIRKFKIPSFNFNALHYTDIIAWHDKQISVTEPPLTKSLSAETLNEIVENGLGIKDNIALFPCHTQTVERCIKLVTEASGAVCGEKKRDGFIRARLTSRQMMPFFNTKREFSI